MRTTLTLNDELADALKRRAFESGKSFKAVVNEVISLGLAAEPDKPVRRRKFRTPQASLGDPNRDLTKAMAVAADLENEALAEKLNLRK